MNAICGNPDSLTLAESVAWIVSYNVLLRIRHVLFLEVQVAHHVIEKLLESGIGASSE